MNEARNDADNCATAQKRRLESLLRVALEQWPFKSEADREHERRLIERDLARLEAN